jgi:hypothetical protein
MSTTPMHRRSSWIPLPPRVEVAEQTGSMAAVNRDLAARELLRNAPEVFETGWLKGYKPSYDWRMMYLPVEVEIIVQCAQYTAFNTFFDFMIALYPDTKEERVLMRSIRLWSQIMENRGE